MEGKPKASSFDRWGRGVSSLQLVIECPHGGSSRRLPLFLKLIELVVHRFQANPELCCGSGFVAAMLLQNAEYMFHLNITQRSGAAWRAAGCGCKAQGRRTGHRPDVVRQV